MDEQRKVMTGILIEKAEAIEAIKGAFEYPEYYGTAIRLAVNAIKKIPTIEAKPVVHAHWFLLDDCANEGVYCSACTKKVYKTDYANQKLKSKYCPNCGAQMDEDIEHANDLQ